VSNVFAPREGLKRHAKLAQNRSPDQAAKPQMDLRMAPVRYAFAQEVTLYQREPVATHEEKDDNGGGTVSPHWRRGHWRAQPCGPGRQERRRVAIPAVLVNAHRFLGAPSDTQATYTLRDR
jgi:hypothetical protein